MVDCGYRVIWRDKRWIVVAKEWPHTTPIAAIIHLRDAIRVARHMVDLCKRLNMPT